MEKSYELKISLTEKEIELMRNCLSDLGTSDKDCVSLQLKTTNAILDTDYNQNKNKKRKIKVAGFGFIQECALCHEKECSGVITDPFGPGDWDWDDAVCQDCLNDLEEVDGPLSKNRNR
jgi:hypothetical protein